MYWTEFFIWLYALPFLVWLSAIFYNKRMNKILFTEGKSYVSFFEEYYSPGDCYHRGIKEVRYGDPGIALILFNALGDILNIFAIIIFVCSFTDVKANVNNITSTRRGFYKGLIFTLVEIIIIILVIFLKLSKEKKNHSIDIQIKKIEEAIKIAPSADIKETLIRAEKRLQDQMKMSIVKEGIDALQELQQSVDCIDIQFELDKLKAYEKLSENDCK